ncbi:hypothetical protein J6590_088550 [Homalodisca vitripennis]|nr:hypothetical protein J6590_080695 [Homalodisca vitripennis]KAG8299955.1 hypothetical protein J6590_088550 [Homalodisca vitripennis]
MSVVVDSDNYVSGNCNSGIGLPNTNKESAPPSGKCLVLAYGNMDVAAAGWQVDVQSPDTALISKARSFSPHTSPIQETITIANAYISEPCVRSERFFKLHGQHLRESEKRLVTGLMAAHLASMESDPRRHHLQLVASLRHTLPTALARLMKHRNPIFMRRRRTQGCCIFKHLLTPLKAHIIQY